MLQFQQQAEIVTTFLFILPPSPSPHSTKTERKSNSELLHHNYIVMYKVHHICFCYYADYDPSGNSNIVQFGEKRNTKQTKKKKPA